MQTLKAFLPNGNQLLSAGYWLTSAELRELRNSIENGELSGMPSHRCPYAALIQRHLVSTCTPLLPGVIRTVRQEAVPLEPEHWEQPGECPDGVLVTQTFFLYAVGEPAGGWDEQKLKTTLATILMDMQRAENFKAGNVTITWLGQEGTSNWQARVPLVNDDEPCRG